MESPIKVTPPLGADRRWSVSSAASSSSASENSKKGKTKDLPALLPLSHAHPLLNTLDTTKWSVDDFLLSRAHIPLEELRTELRTYLAKLKEELGELINDDYEEFISLGLGLRGEGEKLRALKGPLRELKEEVEVIHTSLSTSENEVKSLLDERAALRADKELINLLLHLTDSIERTENLLGIGPSTAKAKTTKPTNGSTKLAGEDDDFGFSDDHSEAEDEPRAIGAEAIETSLPTDTSKPLDTKTLARIANEYTQVTYLLDKGKAQEAEFVSAEGPDGEDLESRVLQIRKKLCEHLDIAFDAALSQSRTTTGSKERATSKKQMEECLKIYNNIKEYRAAESVIRKQLSESLKRVVTSQALMTAPSPAVPATPAAVASQNPFSPALKTPFTPMTAAASQENGNVFETTLQNQSNQSGDQVPAWEPIDEDSSSLAKVYNTILRLISDEFAVLLQPTERIRGQRATQAGEQTDEPQDQPNRFEILANVIWPEIGTRIMEEIGNSVFAAGRVNELHKNYIVTQKFLDRLEAFSSSADSVEAMRASSVYVAFDKRWQLPVYFQLRWKEIIAPVEECLGSGVLGSERPRDGFSLPQTAAVRSAIESCWSPEIHISELSGRFWRLTLQILSRYRDWIDRSAPALFDSSQRPAVAQNGPSGRTSLNLSRSSTPVPGPTLPHGDPSTDPAAAAAEDNVLKVCSVIAADIRHLDRQLRQLWLLKIDPMLRLTVPEADLHILQTAFEHALRSTTALTGLPDSHIISILTRRSSENLKLVRSIASQLRSSGDRQTTSGPSPFISTVLKPVKDYFGSSGMGANLKEEVGAEWSRSVFTELVSNYSSILLSVRKTEDLLRRHRKGKKTGFSLFGSGSSAAAASQSTEQEEERFNSQMLTDIEALGEDAKSLGIDVNSEPGIDGWMSLKDVAQRPVVEAS